METAENEVAKTLRGLLSLADAENRRLRGLIACQRDLLNIAVAALEFYDATHDPRSEPAYGALRLLSSRRAEYRAMHRVS